LVFLLLLIGLCSRLAPSSSSAPAAPSYGAGAAGLQESRAGTVQLISQPHAPAAALGDAPDRAITVAGWNVGLDDADVAAIAGRIAAVDGVDLWGIAELNRSNAAGDLEQAAESGEPGDFAAVVGRSGDGMRLAALYDDTRFDLLEWYELDAINTTGNARAPLVLYLRDSLTGEQFLFMVNHLYRSRNEERYKQAELLNAWAQNQELPVIAVGDYNFDWEIAGGDRMHDRGYDLMTAGDVWEWVRPAQLVTTQCSGWPCRYESVLDFVFAGGPARDWQADSEILVIPGDFPDDTTTSDHRPVLARFWPDAAGVSDSAQLPAPTPVSAVPPEATANRGANLRGGPGTNYPVVGAAAAGQALAVVGRNAAGDWLQLADGSWIAAFLVDGAPGALGSVAAPPAPPPPEAPPTSTPAPAAAPTAVPPANQPAVRQPQTNCDPSYPTLCIPVGSSDLDCGDISARRFPVVGSDPHRFDGDHDGVGCESG
jgi:endonuclease/exonuclease/phosphatase family metal-dependent hydrolase